ncbi:unnamed protein product [Hapterophycus canaliculatus]
MEEQQHRPHSVNDRWSYTRFVQENPIAARTLESLLQYSGFFAPAGFADRDLSIESGYALSSLAALGHDQILLQGRGSLDERWGGSGTSCFGRAEDGEQRSVVSATGSSTRLDPMKREMSSSVTVLAERMRVALAIIAHVQVVVEKLAGQHGGPRRRRQAITYLETLKALSRLLLLACTREMVIGGGAYVSGGKQKSSSSGEQKKLDGSRRWREVDLSGMSSRRPQCSRVGVVADNADDDCPASPSRCPPEVYTGKRSGVRLIVPPRASVVWSGRGRSNRPIGVGRATAAAPPPSCDASRCSRRVADGSSCSYCRSRDGTVDPRGFGCGHGGREQGAGRPDGAADGDLSYADARWRQRQQAQEEDDGVGGVSQSWLMAGEVIHILRPLVYSYSCGSAGERSWRPWLTSLGMDAAAYACTARAGGRGVVSLLAVGGAGSSSGSTGGVQVLSYLDEEQQAELRRRKMLWLLYLMRSPAFELLAEPVARGAAGAFEGVPVLSGMVGYALNMLLYIQRHHFYTSAS